MTARQIAEQDIKNDLMQQSRSFITFRTELNPIMRKLVHQQLHAQYNLFPKTRNKTQLMAHCFFCKSMGQPQLNDYTEYYTTK